MFLLLADGEGFEPPVELPPQRFSRPPHSTALPPIRNSFYRRSFNLRFCSLIAPIGAAHHSFTLDFAMLVSLTRMQDRRIRPLCHPSETLLTDGLSTYGLLLALTTITYQIFFFKPFILIPSSLSNIKINPIHIQTLFQTITAPLLAPNLSKSLSGYLVHETVRNLF